MLMTSLLLALAQTAGAPLLAGFERARCAVNVSSPQALSTRAGAGAPSL